MAAVAAKRNGRAASVQHQMTGKQIINMLLSVKDQRSAKDAILVFEDYADRRAEEEGIDPKRCRRGLVSRVTKRATREETLALLNWAQDLLVNEGRAVGAASFSGTYVKRDRPLTKTRGRKPASVR